MTKRQVSLIEENKDFLADEAVTYYKTKYPDVEFDKEFCRRDVHMICDIICGDLNLEGFVSSITFAAPDVEHNYYALNRYKGSFLCLRQQNVVTFDVVAHIIGMIKKVAQSQPVEPVLGKHEQTFDPQRNLTAEQIAEIGVLGTLIAGNVGKGRPRTQYTVMMEDYFDKGFIHTTIPSDIYSRLWEQVHKTNWVDAVRTTYKKKPDWYYENEKHYLDPMLLDRPTHEKLFAKETISNTPPDLIKIAEDLLKDPMFDYIKLFRPPNPVVKCVHFWNGSENSPHHNDGVDGTDLMIFCYLTDEEGWDEEWGGYINMLKEVGGQFYHTKNIMPIDGTMVCVNNSAPIFKHGIRDLKRKDKNRYTFIFHYTWTF